MFRIDIPLHRIYQLTPEILKKYGIKGLLLDLDNTLTTHDNPVPADGTLDWIALMKENNIQMYIVSNNHEPRVKPFADMLGLPFVCEGKKPLSKGFKEAQKKMNLKKSELAAVGDQIFTDVLGANWFGVKCVYVEPIEHEKTNFFKFKRKMEVPFLPKKYLNMEESDNV
jgi:hypothetical protein